MDHFQSVRLQDDYEDGYQEEDYQGLYSDHTDAQTGTLDPTALCGTWLNTNPASRGIVKVVLAMRDDTKLSIQVFGAQAGGRSDWGEVQAERLYSHTPAPSSVPSFAQPAATPACIACVASYDFGFMQTQLGVNLNQGLLVIGIYNTFHDNTQRSDYFVREFFYREDHPHTIQ